VKVNELINIINKLSADDQSRIARILAQTIKPLYDTQAIFQEANERKASNNRNCVLCGSDHVVKWGKTSNEMQRYRCATCNRTFCETTGTPLYHCRKRNNWLGFIQCELQGYSLRESAKICGISWVTAFYWRHKFYVALAQFDVEHFVGITEADETFILESQKGQRNLDRKARKRGGSAKKRGISNEQVCILALRDRSKSTFLKIIGTGRPSIQEIDQNIGNRLDNTNILCSDALVAYSRYANVHQLSHHYSFKSHEKCTKGIYHIQNVNSLHSRLKRWLRHFNGVATKYLDGYLAMFTALDKIDFEDQLSAVRKVAVSALLNPIFETRKSLRLKTLALD
jgi:transposase-like protein